MYVVCDIDKSKEVLGEVFAYIDKNYIYCQMWTFVAFDQ